MTDVFIVSACRTPIGKFMGGLSSLGAPRLGAVAIREAVRRAKLDPTDVEEVLMGCVLQAGLGQNPARQAALFAGLPSSVGAHTINMVCGSGMEAIISGVHAVQSGAAEAIVAGGMESMSNAPYLLPEARRGSRLGHVRMIDSVIHDGLWDIYNDFHMGVACERVVEKYRVTRREMDEFALGSHRKAITAIKAGKFRKEIVPVEVKGEKGENRLVETDEGPREDASLEKLAVLKPAFKPDGGVTAGNSSTINDGAAAVVLMSEKEVRHRSLTPLARITGSAVAGLDPQWVMMTPVEAVQNLEAKCGLKRAEFDLIEINEAFAAQQVAVIRELNLDPQRVNVHGGAIALGHPIGASGARIVVTLLAALEDRRMARGLATLCMGGGNGLALSVQRA